MFEMKRPGRQNNWAPAGADLGEAETNIRALNDRAQSSTIVWVRNTETGAVAVYEVGRLGPVGPRGSYQAFYGTNLLPS